MDVSLRGLSLNVAELNNPLKGRRIWREEHIDIVCRQEAILQNQEEKFLKEVFPGLVFHAPVPVKKGGVAIVIAKKFDWESENIIKYIDGHFIIIQGSICGVKWCFVGVYAPQTGKSAFFKSLIYNIDLKQDGNLILIGDFNVVVNEDLDKSSKTAIQSSTPKILKWLSKYFIMYGGGRTQLVTGTSLFSIIIL